MDRPARTTEPDKIDLRCPACGALRTPYFGPLAQEGTIVVVCHSCIEAYRRRLLTMPMADLLYRP